MLEREAGLLKGSLYDAYERAKSLPLNERVQTSMLPFFQFAERRRAGFDLLFRSEQGGPGRDVGERAVDDLTVHVIEIFRAFEARTGRPSTAIDGLLAAASVGVARQVCEYALDNGYNLAAAEAVATAFTQAALRGIDSSVLKQAGMLQA